MLKPSYASNAARSSSKSDAPILYIFSGAGLSAESGVPTFRCENGLWEKFDLDRVCNIYNWKEHRSEVFEFYSTLLLQLQGTQPNAAHQELASWQKAYGSNRVRLMTQNVDTLLEQAGAGEVIHLHGNLSDLQCTACATVWRPALDDYHEETRCPKCNSLRGVKPGVVFFGERAENYRHIFSMHKKLRQQDLVLVVGSSMEVVDVKKLLPAHRLQDHPNNWQVNPQPVDMDFFGRVVPDVATTGLVSLRETVAAHMGPPLV